MSSFLKGLIAVCIFSLVAGMATEAPGFVEGHLKIVSGKEVELADGNAPAMTAENYAQYPLIILSQGEKRNRAGYCGREWKLSHCIAAGRLCLGCERTRTRSCSRETTTIHGCFEPDCARRYGYRHGRSLDCYAALSGLLFCVEKSLKAVCAFSNVVRPDLLGRKQI